VEGGEGKRMRKREKERKGKGGKGRDLPDQCQTASYAPVRSLKNTNRKSSLAVSRVTGPL